MNKFYAWILRQKILLFIFFVLEKSLLSSCQTGPIVKTLSGFVLGTIDTSRNGFNFYSFRGIPYAKAPINALRFKPPVPVESWEEILNANEDAPACPQEKKLNQSEDCLYLNIYTRQINESTTPVLIYIHGGGFNTNTGQSVQHGPQYLLDHDIILVTFNYRLGTLGFFSTGDKHAPGNYGLKDQVLALKWIKNNIQFFGGDPSKITISGESAGAASVGLHLIAPMSKGLFHKAMLFSGSAINPWVVNKYPMKWAKNQAELLNCSTESSEKIVECMSKVPVDDIISSYKNMRVWHTERRLWRPVIEVGNDEGEKFIAKDPLISILEDGVADVPVVIGTTRDEMILRAINILRKEEQAEELSRNWTHLAPIIGIYDQYGQNDTVHLKLREFYFGNINTPITMNDSVNELGQTSVRVCPCSATKLWHTCSKGCSKWTSGHNWTPSFERKVLKIAVKNPQNATLWRNSGHTKRWFMKSGPWTPGKNKHPVYLYQFNYQGKDLPSYFLYYIPDQVAHANDLFYMFDRSFYLYDNFNPKNISDGPFVTRFTTLWKNFVETGNPTPTSSPDLDNVIWEPYTKKNPKYLDINDHLTLRDGLYYEKRMELWESLFPIDGIN